MLQAPEPSACRTDTGRGFAEWKERSSTEKAGLQWVPKAKALSEARTIQKQLSCFVIIFFNLLLATLSFTKVVFELETFVLHLKFSVTHHKYKRILKRITSSCED